jgi:hypothetical protein
MYITKFKIFIMKEKLKMLVKPTEFVVMMALPVLGLVFGGVSLKWALIIMAGYCVMQLTGWGVKRFQDVIDETKDNVKDIKEKVEKEVDRFKK